MGFPLIAEPQVNGKGNQVDQVSKEQENIADQLRIGARKQRLVPNKHDHVIQGYAGAHEDIVERDGVTFADQY